LVNKKYEIDQKKENIQELNKRILTSEQEQIEKLRKENDGIRGDIKNILEKVEVLEKLIVQNEQAYKDGSNLKDKLDFNNEQSIIIKIKILSSLLILSKFFYLYINFWEFNNF